MIGPALGTKHRRLSLGQLTRPSGHVCFGSAFRVSFSHSTGVESHDFTNTPDLSLVQNWEDSLSEVHVEWTLQPFLPGVSIQCRRCRRSIFSHDDQRPCPHSHLSKAKACQLGIYRVRASSLEKSHLARSHNPPPMIPLITAPSSPTPPPHGHITVNQEPHLSDIILPSFPISLFLKSLIII